MKDLSGYTLEKLREGPDLVLSRGRQPGNAEPILVLEPVLARQTAAIVDQLNQEYSLAGELDPLWAVRPLALLRHQGQPALVLQDNGGDPLAAMLGRPLEVGLLLDLAIALATALGQMHGCGFIHKDIKPANVLVDASGAVRLTGFGFASRLPRDRQEPTPPEGIAGTLAYMAPEQTGRMNRSVDSRSDLYSLGVSLYEMAVGSLPFTASDPMEWVHCHIARLPVAPSVRRSDIAQQISAIIMKLLAKAPEDRYQTAAVVQPDLRRCLADWQAHGQIEAFAPGAHDVPNRLVVPEKLYGRENEIALLVAAFERVVKHGATQLALVSGFSGVGKSSVVNELHKVLVPPRGLFASGKFDQYKRDIPYATLAQAFQSLVRQILTRTDAQVLRWRESLLGALGSNGQLIVSLIPEIELIIGKQAPVPELLPQDAKNRFQMVLRRFIGVFARPEHPLALFLDDLQWMDAATLELIAHLITDAEVRHLFLVGAYRDNEVGPSHPLMQALEGIRKAGARVQNIVLTPLGLDDLISLVADTFHLSPEHAGPLSKLVQEKTSGNPFFAIQFISVLADEKLVAFDTNANAWTWDLDGIRAKGFTDNVVDLMVTKLRRLPDMTQAALGQLACLGNSADTTTVTLARGGSNDELHEALWEAVRAGLLVRQRSTYTFVHDQIQEAAYALIPEGERAAAHLRIGRVLAAQKTPAEIERNIFEIVNQLNRGVTKIDSLGEQEQLAELNLIAGKRAKAATAYRSALTYLQAGCTLMATDSWHRQYRTTFDLQFHLADCKFLMGEVVEAEEALAFLHAKSANLADAAMTVIRRVILYTYLARSDRAIEIGSEYLGSLGVTLPIHPTDEDIAQEYRSLGERIGTRTVASLIDLPLMESPYWRAVMDLLENLTVPAGIFDPNLRDLACLRTANISLDHGNADESCHAYANLAFFLGPRFGHFDIAFQFGQLSVDLVHKRGLNRYEARVDGTYAAHIAPWVTPLRDRYTIARHAGEVAMKRGDVTYAGYAWWTRVASMLDSGVALADVEREGEIGLAYARLSKFSLAVELIAAQFRLVRALRGLTRDFASFSDAEFDECEHERHLDSSPHLLRAETKYWIRKLQLQYHAGEYAACLVSASKAKNNLAPPYSFEVAEHCFYSALARAAVLASASKIDQAAQLDVLRSEHKQLVVWADRCPENFADRASLVAAELARLEGRDLDAQRLFEDAIQLAREHGFVQNEGIANELAARFYVARNFETIANTYLRNARKCYVRWGAVAKVRQLDKRHPQLHGEQLIESLRVDLTNGQLDVAAVIGASQALSGEIILDRLIERLLMITVQHAGAVRGLLILFHKDGPRIAAEASIVSGNINVAFRDSPVTSVELPESSLNYVTRTGESVLIGDATVRNLYSDDEYVRTKRPRSVLCMPIIKQAKPIGALYLENNLSPHAFTANRITVLDLLMSQAAIALENATLYADLKRENWERKQAEDERGRVAANLEKALSMVRQSEDQLRTIISSIPTMAWSARADGYADFFSQRWLDYCGLSTVEAQGNGWTDVVHPDDRAMLFGIWAEILAAPKRVTEVEARIRRFDGEYRWFLFRTEPMRDQLGNLVKWYGTNTDIEDRKRAEVALRRSNAYLEHGQRLSHTGSVGLRISDGRLFWSAETARIYGYDPAIPPTTEMVLQRVHPEDVSLLTGVFEGALKGGAHFDFEHRLLMPDGSVKRIHNVADAVTDDEGQEEVRGSVMDITAQHANKAALEKAFEAIKKSENHLRTIIDTIPALAWKSSTDGSGDYYSQRWLEYTGISTEQAQGLGWTNSIHADDVGVFLDQWARIMSSRRPGEVEARFRRYDGAYRWFLFSAAPSIDQQGTLLNWYGTNSDIDDLKRAESLLAGEKKVFEMIATGQPLSTILDELCGVVEKLVDGSIVSILLRDPDSGRLRHYAAPSLPANYTTVFDSGLISPSAGSCGEAAYLGRKVVTPDITDDPCWVDCRDVALAHGLRAFWSAPILSSEHEILGAFMNYSRQARVVTPLEYNTTERFTHLASIAVKRRRAEESLKKSEAFLAEGQRISRTGSFKWNASTGEILWSGETFRIFGFDPATTLTFEKILQQVHPDDQMSAQELFLGDLREGDERQTEYRLLMPDGSIKHLFVVTRVVKDDAGGLEVSGALLDITAAKQGEAKLQASLDEKEVLLKEVHHRVKNNLQLISSLLSLQAARIADPAVAELFQESRNRVRSMALVHENLYRAGDFARIPMGSHIQTLCAHLVRAYGLQGQSVELCTSVEDVELDLDRAISAGLIINELVSNAIKHAFPNGLAGRVSVMLKLLDDGRCLLSVEDNGVGLPPGFEDGLPDSLGLRLVHTLALQLHGTTTLSRENGTTFSVAFNADNHSKMSS